MMRRWFGIAAALLIMAALPRVAFAQRIEAGDLVLRFSGRVQTQFNTTSVDDDEIGKPIAWSTFETRRIRFGVDVAYGDWLTARIEPDFALGDLDLKDAWVNWAFDPAFQVRFGQFKKPFSRVELISSSQIIPIERGVRIRGLDDLGRSIIAPDGTPIYAELDGDPVFGDEYTLLDDLGYLGRDLGAAIHGGFGGRLGYTIGVFNGEGSDRRDVAGGKSIAGRLVFEPFASAPLSIAAGVSHRETRIDSYGGLEREVGGTAYEIDAEWGAFRSPGPHILLEGSVGDSFVIPEMWFAAAQAWLSYFHPRGAGRVEGLEPLVRLSWADPDTGRDGDHGLLLTPGFNLYFTGRNRIMVNWDVFFSGLGGVDTEHAFRVQGQVYF